MNEMPIPAAPAASAPAPNPSGAACVILNAGAGAGAPAARIEALRAAFERHPGRFELRVARSGRRVGPEAARAIGEGFETIVAAGGDGTICAVAAEVARSGRRLGLIPLGTFNFLARSLGAPSDIDAAVAVIAAGRERRWDIGEINGRVFLNNASLGAYPAILQRREGVYDRWGRSRIAAYWSVLSVLLRVRRPLTMRISIDGEVRRRASPLAFVANNPHQLEVFDLPGGDCLADGAFALFLAPDCGRWELVRYALRLAFRRMEPGRDFELLCGRDILVETPQRRRLVACDGERMRMTGPFRLRRRVGALRIVAPADDG